MLINVIAVYRALGGGWQIRLPGFEPRILAATDALEGTAEPIPPPVPVPIGEGRDRRVRELPPLPSVDEPTENVLDG